MNGLLMADNRAGKRTARGQKDKRPMVALDPVLHKKLKMVCTDNDVQMQDYVDSLIRVAVEREYKSKFGDRPV